MLAGFPEPSPGWPQRFDKRVMISRRYVNTVLWNQRSNARGVRTVGSSPESLVVVGGPGAWGLTSDETRWVGLVTVLVEGL